MSEDFYQAVYAHPDEGWAVINSSEDLPQNLANDFAAFERGNAGLTSASLTLVGKNETPSCMSEIYFKNDALGLVRIQYGLSDVQGRPVSFAHGYIFPDAYTLMKTPEKILSITKDNFADQRIGEEEKMQIRSAPGALNKALIDNSAIINKPSELLRDGYFSIEDALETCGISADIYYRFILSIYVHVLSANSDNNLYIKTDGSNDYNKKLLYLIYSAIPFSMRTRLSASTYLHAGQHNTKLILCAELPDNMPHVDPVSGDNNVMNAVLEKRTRDRNPFISKGIDYTLCGKNDLFFSGIESCLRLMGDEKLASMQAINLAYRFGLQQYDDPAFLPGMLYSWITLPVPNTENWENGVCFLLEKAENGNVLVGDEIKKALEPRINNAVTNAFMDKAKKVLN